MKSGMDKNDYYGDDYTGGYERKESRNEKNNGPNKKINGLKIILIWVIKLLINTKHKSNEIY